MKTLLSLIALVAIAACPALASPADHSSGPGISQKVDSPPLSADFLFDHAKARYVRAVESVPLRAPVIGAREIQREHVESLFCPIGLQVRPQYEASYRAPNDLVYRKASLGYIVERRATCGWQEAAAR